MRGEARRVGARGVSFTFLHWPSPESIIRLELVCGLDVITANQRVPFIWHQRLGPITYALPDAVTDKENDFVVLFGKSGNTHGKEREN